MGVNKKKQGQKTWDCQKVFKLARVFQNNCNLP